jgi:outer membrane protein assembly factor BamB
MPGERIPLVDVVGCINQDDGLRILRKGQVTLPSEVANLQWSGGINHIPSYASNLSWRYEGNGPRIYNFSSASNLANTSVPAVHNGVIYTLSINGQVVAYDIASDKVLWTNQYYELLERVSVIEVFSKHFLSGALYVADNKLFVTAGLNKVIALNLQDGGLIWEAELEHPVRSMPLMVEGVVVMQSINDHLFGLDANTGKTRWMQLIGFSNVSSLTSAAPIGGDKKIVFVHTADDVVLALDPKNGQEVWSNEMVSTSQRKFYLSANSRSAISQVDSLFAAHDKVISADAGGVIFAIDARTGETVWERGIIGADSVSMWISGNAIFALLKNQQLIALDVESGATFWVCDLRNEHKSAKDMAAVHFSNPVVAEGKLHIANNLGELIVINPATGQVNDSIAIPVLEYINLIVVSGKMIMTSSDGSLVIL